jgi:RluA family pseudouridine synthase
MSRDITVLFEDADLLVIDKPAGVLSVPGRQGGISIREVLERQRGEPQDFRLVHRLDRDTSGVMVLTKHVDAQRIVSEQFGGRSVSKQYLAIVRGVPEDESGLIHAAIAEDPRRAGRMIISDADGKPAQTRWRLVERLAFASLIRCWPLTGRQHQIRVHMKLMGMPLLVDALYGDSEAFYLSQAKGNYHASRRHEERPLIGRLTLHAEQIQFTHPGTGQTVQFQSPLPRDFRAVLTQLRKLAGSPPVPGPGEGE